MSKQRRSPAERDALRAAIYTVAETDRPVSNLIDVTLYHAVHCTTWYSHFERREEDDDGRQHDDFV